ncbi:MAG: nuclear transport factor 2 family protein [Pseudomonadota bacterium]
MTTATTAALLEHDREINDAILNGQALKAFEAYYADNIVMRENDGEETVGKDANRLREAAFFDAITEFRGARVLASGAGDNTTFSHWYFDFTHRDWGERRYHQVAVREWHDGRVVRETFYYG